ncbi:hypothetical protein [Flammeovirga aprica]|uniref:Uncharacterized protein n=1 Tax=Flammeovirga aprica JL-4 TaxID=694437 RepID=A0A7X9RWR0_9BACT|nr:hypothetical protein [Flammeovirga aprica]NME70141.1 hypothetical protein [Flammeovirga aprica JL-4]
MIPLQDFINQTLHWRLNLYALFLLSFVFTPLFGTENEDPIILISNDINIDGGFVSLTGGEVQFSNHPVLNINGDSATIIMDRLNAGTEESAVTINFIFNEKGISKIVSNEWMSLSHAIITVDGSAYAGDTGTFELFKSNNLMGDVPIHLLVDFPGYKSTFSKNDSSWSVTLRKMEELPFSYFNIFPAEEKQTLPITASTKITTITDTTASPSTSPWKTFEDDANTYFDESIINDEKSVLFASIKHDAVNSDKSSFEMRIGQGGQVYSIRNSTGKEVIPPQHREATNKKMAPWIDEVFQLIQVNIKKQYDTSTPHYFIHQAGTYFYADHMEKPFYSPVLMSAQLDENTFVMANWAQQGHLDKTTGDNIHHSKSIIYTKYSVVAEGVVEVTHLAYNFGEDELDFFNAPWGGVRMTTYPEVMLGENTIDGTVTGKFFKEMPGYTTSESTFDIRNTGGWLLYGAGTSDTDEAMALVFGKDFTVNPNRNDVLRFGSASKNGNNEPETEWRNYNVTEVIRYQNLTEGQSLLARYYYVFGSVSEVKNLIDDHDLVQSTKVEVVSTSDDGRVYNWRRNAVGEKPVLYGIAPVHLQLRNNPVDINFKPVFLIKYDDQYIPTYDPYKYTEGKPFKRNTQYIGLLGYADTRIYDEKDLY